MKYIVILGDGMADFKVEALGNKTPLEAAKKPNIDGLCKKGKIGLVKTCVSELPAGSDVANLSCMGYNPLECYTGRSPLEAVSIGINLTNEDTTFRVNLVSIDFKDDFNESIMSDYSAGEISTAEAKELIEALKKYFDDEKITLYSGVSYRHCLVIKDFESKNMKFTPPHDISDKAIGTHLPSGSSADYFLTIMKASYKILKNHPVNIKRVESGKAPANMIWPWGMGTKPRLAKFTDLYNLKGSVISAVDLIKGIGIVGGLDVIEVEGATGNIDTNFSGKANACLETLEKNDYCYVHIEAPDECGHRGEIGNKVKAIELIDELVVAKILKGLRDKGEDFKMLVLPDHPTPLVLKTHTKDPVPFVLYDSRQELNNEYLTYNEDNASASKLYYESGAQLVADFLDVKKANK